MITSQELNKAGAMVQRTDGDGWNALAKENGDQVLLDAIVHLVKQRGQPAPLSAVRAYLRPVTMTAENPKGRKADSQGAAPKEPAAPKAVAKEETEADPLLAKITAPGMPNRVAAILGIHNSSIYQWRHKGAIPANRRDAVEEAFRQVEAGGDLPAPKEAKAKPKAPRRSSDARVALEAVAKGLGIEVVPVYVIQGDRLVERQGVVW